MATKRSEKNIGAVRKAPKIAPKHLSVVPALTLTVEGPGVTKGRISIPDLIKVCEEAQNAVTRQAEALEGRKNIHPGPSTAGIREECTLDLISIDEGSTVLGFDLAQPQMILPSQKNRGLEALREIVNTIHSLGNGDTKKDHNPGVLRSIYGLSGIIDRNVTSLTWNIPNGVSGKDIKARITKKVRERVAVHLSHPSFKVMQIDGVLNMADFSRKDRKCRVDPAIGGPVVCLFETEFEETVQDNLRKPVRIHGPAKIQPDSDRVECLQISAIEPLSSLSLGEGNFFHSLSIEELVEARDVKPFSKAKATEWFASDAEVEEFISDIYSAREKP